jgi:hypothetical protein
MKIYNKLLALCVFRPITAFFAIHQTPVAPTYLRNWAGGEGAVSSETAKAASVSQPTTPPFKNAESKPSYKWDSSPPVTIQGGALRTCTFPGSERLAVFLMADGNRGNGGGVLKAKIDLNQGPDNTPFMMEIYSGKGNYRPFKAVIETPGSPSSLFIRNIAPIEFPLVAHVSTADSTDVGVNGLMSLKTAPQTLQGGAILTFPLKGSVSSVKVKLSTTSRGRPLNAMIELVQGPNAPKHTINLYAENGEERPFFGVMDTPGAGNVVRIVNTAAGAFPLTVWVEEVVGE